MKTFAAALLIVGTFGISLTSLLTDQGQDQGSSGQGGQVTGGSCGQGGSGAKDGTDTDLGEL